MHDARGQALVIHRKHYSGVTQLVLSSDVRIYEREGSRQRDLTNLVAIYFAPARYSKGSQ